MARILGRVLWTQSSGDLMKTNVVIQGDCLEVMRGMEDNSADLILTDPPYNAVNRKTGGLRIINKGGADSLPVDIPLLCSELSRITRGSIYQFMGIGQISKSNETYLKNGMTTRLGVWVKTNPSPMNGSRLWLSGTESILFARKPQATFNRHCASAVWIYATHPTLHPCEKPIDLISELILASSNPNDLILDPFAGSGSTLVAAKQLGRRYIGIEIEPKYVAICNERLKQEVLAL